MGKGLIEDLLNHTVNNTTQSYASIEFYINTLFFIPAFIPEDLTGMAFTPFNKPAPGALPAATNTGSPAPAPGNPQSNAPPTYFNIAALPPDVKQRYQLSQATNSVMTSADMSSFIAQPASQNPQVLYHQVHPTVYVTRTGDLFILSPVDSKIQSQFIKNAPTCNSWAPTGIRRWYVHFMQHAMRHSMYVHPLCLYVGGGCLGDETIE